MLQQFQHRYNEVLNDFHRIRDDIPPAFKRAFAAHELEKKGIANLIGVFAEQTDPRPHSNLGTSC